MDDSLSFAIAIFAMFLALFALFIPPLSDIEGVITDAQHGVKTNITDAHHNMDHRHAIMLEMWSASNETEFYTDSVTYVPLISTIAKAHITHILKFTLTMNIKNVGTTSARGATFKITAEDDFSEWDICDTEFRWTDGLADYKVMTFSLVQSVFGEPEVFGDVFFTVYWKVDNTNYECYANGIFFTVESWWWGGEKMTPD